MSCRSCSRSLQSLSFRKPRVLWLLAVALPCRWCCSSRCAAPAGHVGCACASASSACAWRSSACSCWRWPSRRCAPAGHGRAVVFALDVSDSVSAGSAAVGARLGRPRHRARCRRAATRTPSSSASAPSWRRRAAARRQHRSRRRAAPGRRAAPARPGAGARDRAADRRLADRRRLSRSTRCQSGVAVSYVPLPAPAAGQQPPAVVHALDAPPIARAGDQRRRERRSAGRPGSRRPAAPARRPDRRHRRARSTSSRATRASSLPHRSTRRASPRCAPSCRSATRRARCRRWSSSSPPGKVLVLEDERRRRPTRWSRCCSSEGLQVDAACRLERAAERQAT